MYICIERERGKGSSEAGPPMIQSCESRACTERRRAGDSES